MNRCTTIRVACLAMLAIAHVGCVSQRAEQQQGPHPQWPDNGQPVRIKHVQDVRGPADAGKPNVLQSIGRFITGRRATTMIQPNSVAVSGNMIVVSDQERQGLHVLSLTSNRSRFIGRIDQTYFVSPLGVAIIDGNIAVADSALNQVAIITPKGDLQSKVAHPFKRPTGLAYDAAGGVLYVVDTLAHEVCVFSADGALLRRFGGNGTDVGQFNFPTHVFVDGQRNVYVTDSLNFRVQAFDSEGRYLFEIGRQGDSTGHMGVPKGVAVDSYGHLYVVDSYFSTVQIFDREGRFLLNFGDIGTRWGQFHVPAGMTIDAGNRIYVCDAYNRRVQVFEYVGGPDDAAQPDDVRLEAAPRGHDR